MHTGKVDADRLKLNNRKVSVNSQDWLLQLCH